MTDLPKHPTLTQVLTSLGLTHEPIGAQYKHVIKADLGARLFEGTAGETWAWLRETGRYHGPVVVTPRR